MPSCTVIRISRSSTARAIPRSWSEEAARLGLAALAITDHDGFYGVVRFAEAAREVGLPTVFGAELTLGAPRKLAERDRRSARRAPDRARARAGRVRPARHGDQRGAARGGEGRAAYVARASWPTPHARRCSSTATRRAVTNDTGSCSRGAARAPCPPRCNATVRRAAERALPSWSTRSAATGCSSSCGTTAIRSTGTATTRSRRSRCGRASKWSRPTTCTTPRPSRRPLATALAAVRARRSLDEIDGWLPAAPFAHLRRAARTGASVRALAGRGRAHGRHRARVRVRPEARGAASCPTIRCPTGHTEMSWLRELVRRGAAVVLPGVAPRSTTRRCARSTTS